MVGGARRALLSLGMIACALLQGCSRGPVLGEVDGTAKLNGKPIGDLQIECHPDKGGPSSLAQTDGQGHFQLTCDDGRRGAILGPHRVLIRDLKVYEGVPPGRAAENAPLKPSRIPERYADTYRTPLKIDVRPGQQTIELNVTTP